MKQHKNRIHDNGLELEKPDLGRRVVSYKPSAVSIFKAVFFIFQSEGERQ